MQMVTIICDVGLEERVLAGLREIGASGYTRMTDLTGSGRTGRRDGDPIWPGTNSLLLVVAAEDEVQRIVDMLHRLKAEYTRPPALHVFTVPALELL